MKLQFSELGEKCKRLFQLCRIWLLVRLGSLGRLNSRTFHSSLFLGLFRRLRGVALVMLLLSDFLGVRDVSRISHQLIHDSQRAAGCMSSSVRRLCRRRSVERDAITFRIDQNGAKAVLANLLPRPQHFSAVLSRSFDRFIQTSLHREINQRSVW